MNALMFFAYVLAIPGGLTMGWRQLPYFAKTLVVFTTLWLVASFVVWDFLNAMFWLVLGTYAGVAARSYDDPTH